MRELFKPLQIAEPLDSHRPSRGEDIVQFHKLFNCERTDPMVYFGKYLEYTKSVILEHNCKCLTSDEIPW